ncbi:ORF110 [Cydia pomonella granulovirus]|uniref:ORF110 n=2 Tax=Cydia pomonella granulosis virus TaxID=28289 RepID=Q91EU5_GVCPM|nr:ORF110 [Cydia pomonella granulovirus]AAK70770.1 ORF110 [Cydia pomonella granulovirus]AIU36757.1 ORF110 [Cydia pomonella granulovirus]AIU37178.1 ORF110 [Cydia pomonella granulovirus]AIU37317.1 ORF110 [Cydia pomonella granulovirus]QDW81170.1 ORF110 [Cydia pomonella granulovirus]
MYQAIADLLYLNGEFEIWKSCLVTDYRHIVAQRILTHTHLSLHDAETARLFEKTANQIKTRNPKVLGMQTAYNFVLSIISDQNVFDEFQRLFKTHCYDAGLMDACLHQLDDDTQAELIYCVEDEIKKIKDCVVLG